MVVLTEEANFNVYQLVFRGISRGTGTGDFEFFPFFPCTGDYECAGDFKFFTFFKPVLGTLTFSVFLVLQTLSFSRLSPVLEL